MKKEVYEELTKIGERRLAKIGVNFSDFLQIEPGEILFRKERRDKVHGKEGKCRRGGLLPKRDGEDFFRQEAGCPRSTYDRTVARVF